MRDILFYVGTLEAEDRARRERTLGYDAHSLDSGVNPDDYSDWQVNGLSVLVYDLADSATDYLLILASALNRAGAASILIFDHQGRYLLCKTPFDSNCLSWFEPRVCA